MYYYCTYFDHRYLARGIALYQSLCQHSDSFQLWVLCLDDTCYDILSQLRLPNVNLVSLGAFESSDPELLKSKGNRSLLEYYFTCTPCVPLFILRTCPEVDVITYLDADLYFFQNPQLVHSEIGDSSIAIIEHRFPPHLAHLTQHGTYNVGWITFRRDSNALECLQWWRERCLESCQDDAQNGKFADQKYLDEWPALFKNLIVLQHRGANLAPWNLCNYRIWLKSAEVFVDEQPLIFYHFHGMKKIKAGIYDLNLAKYGAKHSRTVLYGIYQPYFRMLHDVSVRLPSRVTGTVLTRNASTKTTQTTQPKRTTALSAIRLRLTDIRKLARRAAGIRNHTIVLAVKGRILV